MVVTDLDGTLIRSDRSFHAADLETLERLGREGIVRVIATGRSLHSARTVLDPDFPIDYLIFSTGAGIMDWRRQVLLRRSVLALEHVHTAVAALETLRLPFMVHAPVPDNHRFVFRRVAGRRPTEDFERRLARYEAHAVEWARGTEIALDEASQLLAVAEEGNERAHHRLGEALPDLRVIRATSPLDGRSRWLEIFPPEVSKSLAAGWLAERCGVRSVDALSIGNDYNDEDLLAWAGSAFVVANAPAELRARHSAVGSNDDHGVSQAVAAWRASRHRRSP